MHNNEFLFGLGANGLVLVPTRSALAATTGAVACTVLASAATLTAAASCTRAAPPQLAAMALAPE